MNPDHSLECIYWVFLEYSEVYKSRVHRQLGMMKPSVRPAHCLLPCPPIRKHHLEIRPIQHQAPNTLSMGRRNASRSSAQRCQAIAQLGMFSVQCCIESSQR
ncbi:hypothetical protein TNCV_3086071 [Trichonephila clavipes]|nr:hypothetical protein TNCV_3086071 [Trichonephila clavipes]